MVLILWCISWILLGFGTSSIVIGAALGTWQIWAGVIALAIGLPCLIVALTKRREERRNYG